ncbi:ethanolamine permease [Leptospira langatensis]|uniref:Ethanolamine permease n=1 Tax=Leptospira langatensis TaxID=2484983 RepID=A0A5F1ZR32_9LEPT|nr:ethanolamine permease [Leptospira langatensis]TGK02802.1 ethanolamine permease [Leptospira langatensis]TGL39993.1 ethanolamine permease [Leptospira langatensis]
MEEKEELNRSLGPWLLWGLGVGYVISGMYFGWNLGLPVGGTLGLGIATLLIILLYVCFSFSYTELACMIPKAGGAFDYAKEALGNRWAYLVGTAQLIEFLFAPPAIAAAIGAYFSLFLPGIDPVWISIFAYLFFTALNILGVKSAASFELGVTILAVFELLLFSGLTLPSFSWEKFSLDPLPNGWSGALASLPFAVWFFLAIEGVANVAEETKDPQKNILIGFGSALGTLVLLCALVFFSSVGVGGWQMIVYSVPGGPASDYPLPLALRKLYGETGWAFHLLITIGLFGLIASFHGIILAGSRASFEFGRARFLPSFFGKVHPKFKTPANALLANTAFGIGALLTGKTAELITLSAFGALLLYLGSMISFFVLRRKQPDRERPFVVPGRLWMPAIALMLSVLVFAVTAWQHPRLFAVFVLILLSGILWARKLLFAKRVPEL